MDGVLHEGGEALTEPLLGPVLGSEQQPEPRVTQLVPQSDVHTAVLSQQRLGQEDQARAGWEKKGMCYCFI